MSADAPQVAPQAPAPAPTARADGVYRILSIDGGGYLGLATAAFIEGIELVVGKGRFASAFDLFCGSSTGAILAMGLASGRTGEELRALYERLGRDVFRRRRFFRGLCFGALHPNTALRAALVSEFKKRRDGGGPPAPGAPDLTLGDLRARKKYALVTAFNLTTGRPRIFKTDHAPHLVTDDVLPVAAVVMASSAAPYYLPSVAVHNPKTRLTELFCDGGVVANHPALLGVVEAAHTLHWPLGQVRVLSLAAPGMNFGEGPKAAQWADRSLLLGWGKKLPSMFLEAGSAISGETLDRLIAVLPPHMRPRYVRIEMNNHGKFAINDASRRAQAAHQQEGATLAADGDKRRQVQQILD
jgi:predicted acylesterase/phospholipase RssA